ncbi:hypothetical protein FGLOB1_10152 [Fusarium globosum]|uniref:Uncharacterized protein n=1 Tax=Fusarium globosum TaxID=78864 RepID=A0A8H6D238_9HYPO|nr:hypothetical protein FGLOB1_10152 [Fusarium globosum]
MTPVALPQLTIAPVQLGTVLASNDACYNYPPPRETVLGNLSWWSEQHGLGDGPVSPPDLVKKVSFGDMTAPDFHTLMMDTAINNYGAFILVDHGYVPIKILAQQTDKDQSTPPNGSSNGTTDNSQNNSTGNTQPSPPSTSSTDAINTNAPEPSNAGDNTTVPEPAAPEINTAPVATNSQPGSKMPKVASVEPGDTGE